MVFKIDFHEFMIYLIGQNLEFSYKIIFNNNDIMPALKKKPFLNGFAASSVSAEVFNLE